MPNEKPPRKKAHWPPRAEDDHLHRYPEPYRLDQPKNKDRNEGWVSIAKDQALETRDLVGFNFHTGNAKEINWYLAHYVGCTVPTADGQDYTFKDVVYDHAKNRGVIFIPRFGNSGDVHDNDLGNQVVKDYNKSTDKTPGGLCHRTGRWKGYLGGQTETRRGHSGLGRREGPRQRARRQARGRNGSFVHLPSLRQDPGDDHRHGHRGSGLSERHTAQEKRLRVLGRRQHQVVPAASAGDDGAHLRSTRLPTARTTSPRRVRLALSTVPSLSVTR